MWTLDQGQRQQQQQKYPWEHPGFLLLIPYLVSNIFNDS
jgi:hypothetical protein